jgi:hypothetical protein
MNKNIVWIIILFMYNITNVFCQQLYARAGATGNFVNLNGFDPIVSNYNNTSTFSFIKEKHKMNNFGYLDGLSFSIGGGHKNIFFDAGFYLAGQNRKTCHFDVNSNYITRDLKVQNNHFSFTLGTGLGAQFYSFGLGLATQFGNLTTSTRDYEKKSNKGNYEVLDRKLTTRLGPALMIAFGDDESIAKFMLNFSYCFGLGEYNTSKVDNALNGMTQSNSNLNDLKVNNNSISYGISVAFYILDTKVGFGNVVRDIQNNLKKKKEIRKQIEREENDWSSAKDTNTANAFKFFLTTYPKSKYLIEAKERLKLCKEIEEKKAWQEALKKKDLESMQFFVKNFANKSDSKYLDSAKVIIEELKEKRLKEEFYAKYDFFMTSYNFYIDENKITRDTISINNLINKVNYLSEFPYERFNLYNLKNILLWKLDLANAYNFSLYYLENQPYNEIMTDKLIQKLGPFTLQKEKFTNEAVFNDILGVYNLLAKYCQKYERFFTYLKAYTDDISNINTLDKARNFAIGYPYLEIKLKEIEKSKYFNLPEVDLKACKK